MQPEERLTVLKMAIKCADIGNVTKGVGVCLPWTERVVQEFFEQGDAERELGLPISMNCDRKTVDVNKCQVGFISFIVAPIYKGIAKFVPAVEQQLLPVLDANLEHYKAASS